ncbi:hypothetical protein ALC56_04061 [Trachymyrmex septentrionalis]|uniref:Uncharacterized protein n=1 Tax=Trachymyrmex septentrionalis TaxID=34720 RepID=A0A151JYJ3_9HYME|nr:hypothetical protein ALC56_04061 [Trachymyrmex septentrionalis]
MHFNLFSSSKDCCTVEDNLSDGRECFIAVFTESHVCVMSHTSMPLDKFTLVFSTMDRVSISLGSVNTGLTSHDLLHRLEQCIQPCCFFRGSIRILLTGANLRSRSALSPTVENETRGLRRCCAARKTEEEHVRSKEEDRGKERDTEIALKYHHYLLPRDRS